MVINNYMKYEIQLLLIVGVILEGRPSVLGGSSLSLRGMQDVTVRYPEEQGMYIW